MGVALDLQRYRIQTLWVVDDEGDLLTSNEPNVNARHRAPAVHLEWNDTGILHAFRNDVPSHERSEALKVVKAKWPFSAMVQPTVIGELQRVLGGNGRSYSGTVFIAPEDLAARGDAVRIRGANAELLQGGLADWQEDVEVEQPMFARVIGDRAVSVCATVRRSAMGVEAGVDTLDGYRRQGYGREVVAAWASAIQQEGLTAFYSTSWDNAASIALAKSLGFRQIGASLSVD